MNKKLLGLGLVAVIAGVLLSQSLYTVDEAEQALVLQFGDTKRVVRDPGLNMKVPFVQNIIFYEKRVLDVDPPTEQVILADQRRLNVDAFVRYRIVNPLQFYQTVRDERTARQRLNTVTNAALRRELGDVTQTELLSEERANIMNEIRASVSTESAAFGVEIVDVRIGRADLPDATAQSVFDRMRSEREREAAEFRAQGFEQAQQIRSRAERERTIILAEAEKQSQILRGEGDQEAIRILAEAYGQDDQFFSFYRTLLAYRASLQDDDTTLVLSPSGDFFRYFRDMTGGQGGFGALPSNLQVPVDEAPADAEGGGEEPTPPAQGPVDSSDAGAPAEDAPQIDTTAAAPAAADDAVVPTGAAVTEAASEAIQEAADRARQVLEQINQAADLNAAAAPAAGEGEASASDAAPASAASDSGPSVTAPE